MEKNLQSLISLLENQYKVYNDLYYLLDEEYDCLVAGKTEDIRKVVEAKTKHVEKIDQLEYQRVMLCEDLAKDLNIKEEATISVIASKLDEKSANTLLTWKGTFETLLESLKEKNDTNNMMADSALKNVESTIEAVKESLQTRGIYHKKGSVKNKEQVEHLFSKKA